MTQSHWYISSARDAFEMGHRVIASKLNAVLAITAPGLTIQADPPRLGDSMREAMARFRRALPGLQVLREMPEKVQPWTLGFVNDDSHPAWNIAITDDWELTDPFLFDFLVNKCTRRKRDDWKRLIVDPVEASANAIHQEFAELERIAASASLESFSALSRQTRDFDNLGISLFDIAFQIEEDDAAATAQVKRWVDSKRIKAEMIGKCPLDARRQLYRFPEILSDVAEIFTLSKLEQNKLRQALAAKLRAPKPD